WTRAFVIPEARRSGIDEREQFYRLLDDNTREWMRENPDFEISADGMPISDIREYEFLRRLKPVTKEMMRGHYLQVIGAHLYGSLGAIFGTTFDRYNDAMLENKLDFGAWTGNTLQRMASGDGREALGEFFNGRHFYLQLGAAIWSLGHIFLAVIGMVILLKRRLYFPLIIFGLIIAYHLFSGGIDSPPRFRIPALPFIFIFSAVTINSIFKLKDRNYVK
nr:hypothetical protein [FCB group bacterium]